jgi:hypothetical protein
MSSRMMAEGRKTAASAHIWPIDKYTTISRRQPHTLCQGATLAYQGDNMNVLVMGQLLLGFLAAIALLVGAFFVRLRRRYRRLVARLTPMSPLLLWLPLAAAVMVAGALALAELSLLGYNTSQDVEGLSWFVVGACLMIFANLCVALAAIALREALKVADMAGEK